MELLRVIVLQVMGFAVSVRVFIIFIVAQDQFCTSRGVWVGHGGGVVVKKDPCLTKFKFCQVLCMDGIELQLLCGVRIELAIGSLPYPGNSGFPIVSPG